MADENPMTLAIDGKVYPFPTQLTFREAEKIQVETDVLAGSFMVHVFQYDAKMIRAFAALALQRAGTPRSEEAWLATPMTAVELDLGLEDEEEEEDGPPAEEPGEKEPGEPTPETS